MDLQGKSFVEDPQHGRFQLRHFAGKDISKQTEGVVKGLPGTVCDFYAKRRTTLMLHQTNHHCKNNQQSYQKVSTIAVRNCTRT